MAANSSGSQQYHFVCKEILDTEKIYINNLKHFLSVFYQPAKKKLSACRTELIVDAETLDSFVNGKWEYGSKGKARLRTHNIKTSKLAYPLD